MIIEWKTVSGRLALVLMLAGGGLGCDGNSGSEGPRFGSFSATLTGDRSDSMTGEAVFMQAFGFHQILLVSESIAQLGTGGARTVAFYRQSPLAAGTFEVTDDAEIPGAFLGGYSHDRGNESGIALDFTGGTLTITSVSQDLVTGTFSVTARGVDIERNEVYTDIEGALEGTFEARSMELPDA
jgi:hypothetical protein